MASEGVWMDIAGTFRNVMYPPIASHYTLDYVSG